MPADAEVSVFADQLLVQLRSVWTVGGGGGGGEGGGGGVSDGAGVASAATAAIGGAGAVDGGGTSSRTNSSTSSSRTYKQGALLAVSIRDFVENTTAGEGGRVCV